MRPSRRPLRGLLRMRFFLNAINNLPHPEERPKGASRRTQNADAALVCRPLSRTRPMTSAAWTEVQTAVGGALRLAVGDRRGLRFFDASIEGFWRSFRAGLICYPLYLFLVSFRVAPRSGRHPGSRRSSPWKPS